MIGHYETPMQLKDEDIYFRFFTKTELIVAAFFLIPSFFLIKSAFATGSMLMLYLAFTASFLMIAGSMVCMKFKLPDHMYLIGRGVPIYIIIVRLARKALGRKVIYLNNYEERVLH